MYERQLYKAHISCLLKDLEITLKQNAFTIGNSLYTRYPIVARALGRVRARAKESCIQGNSGLLKS